MSDDEENESGAVIAFGCLWGLIKMAAFSAMLTPLMLIVVDFWFAVWCQNRPCPPHLQQRIIEWTRK